MKFVKPYLDIFRGKADLSQTATLYRIIYILPVMMILLAFCYNTPAEIAKGMWDILLANDVFLTDYIKVTNVGSALFNAGLLTLIIAVLLQRLNLKPTGLLISALFITTGFSFIGKNIYNIWPFYIGGFIYAKVKGMDFRNVVATSIFTASLAPIVSIIAHLMHNSYKGLLLGYAVGIFIGYIMPAIGNHTLVLHSGYTLYNTGVATGFVGAVANAIFKGFNYQVTGDGVHSSTSYIALTILFAAYFVMLIYIGHVNKSEDDKYTEIFTFSGRLVTDFTRLTSYSVTLKNMGIMGLISMAYIFLMDGILCGATIAGLLTVVGFASFGIHAKNSIPVMLGVTLASLFLGVDVHHATIITIGLFSTGLCPLAGRYGALVGIFVGMAHLHVTLSTASWHAGMNLYNNGFSSGIVAMLAIPVLEAMNIPTVKRNR